MEFALNAEEFIILKDFYDEDKDAMKVQSIAQTTYYEQATSLIHIFLFTKNKEERYKTKKDII